jgi:oligogalacturonide transport system permease protein
MKKVDLKKRYFSNRLQQYIGFFFVLPWFLGFLIFKAFPLLMSLYLSFTQYKIIAPPVFNGLDNFIEIFSDPSFYNSVRVTLLYALITIPSRMFFSLFIAFVLSSKVKGIGIFRSVYYIPSLMGGSVAVAILWTRMFMSNGLVNQFLELLSLPAVPWLTNKRTALVVISMLHVWQFGSHHGDLPCGSQRGSRGIN